MPHPPRPAPGPAARSLDLHRRRPLSRRTLLRAAGLAAAGLVLGGAASCAAPEERAGSGQSGDAQPLTIGFVPIACSAPVALADAGDLFTAHGVDVRLKKYAGWADLWTAYATGELDVAHMLSPMPAAIDAGATNATRPTELSFTQNTNGQALTLAAEHHPHVRSAADMRGMVLGIPFEYSVHALLLRDFLAAGGVDPVADVELRLLRPADMVAQLEVGGIDGFIGPEPFNQRALQSGAGRIFTLTRHLWDRHPCCCVAMAKDWRAENPEAARGVVAALTEAAALADDPARTGHVAPVLAQEKYLNQQEGLIRPGLEGTYLDWDGEQVTDPELMSFGDPTDVTAITWMTTQIARWGLGGEALDMDDATIIAASHAVLPADVDRTGTPVLINGHRFDPARPTAGYVEA